MNIPEHLRYTNEHEWVAIDGNLIIIGITDHAQAQLGDITYVELPEVGTQLSANQGMGIVESVKAVSDIYAPIACEVVEVNSSVVEAPDGLNTDPYGDAWLVKAKPANPADLEKLLTADSYKKLVSES